ncbi:MAG: hypothetical protein A3G32_09440 [Deltaproteobacteria bacterium RIFCSPLOWO2_12_FULL_40_28]|nr:MAG: hypothetical protein A3C45_07710 [Deltaproteobacteria bacterium RIFCSPHIGHO2_02_FULL_40_28]OGQ20755.1 MAG: hypothetical protein A3E27_07375 [Deltaproteobacteria bacterium RIFCSPHIGHO2_12_FULL_40_32]OGQ41303.1 MAG: hypothetical protein A3I69_04295 [Deltaproteobacteria bacterium RIFCSPLOWO2_02_FULL_40_36]OGQ55367.1 MAG: hypothetical protein A3G32_09440 [Deltaproteobacteria bacterium RIFCSPLOWO2_12_FULL_40_28]
MSLVDRVLARLGPFAYSETSFTSPNSGNNRPPTFYERGRARVDVAADIFRQRIATNSAIRLFTEPALGARPFDPPDPDTDGNGVPDVFEDLVAEIGEAEAAVVSGLETLLGYFGGISPAHEDRLLTLSHRALLGRLDDHYLERNPTASHMQASALHVLNTTLDEAELARLKLLEGRRAIYLTGLGNPNTSMEFGNIVATAYGVTPANRNKLPYHFAVLGIDQKSSLGFSPYGLYKTSGVSAAAYTPDWILELPQIFLRVAAFIAQDPTASVDIYGYSKGGLQLLHIQRLREVYRQNGIITAQDVAAYPGLETMLPVVNSVITHLNTHESVAVGLGVPPSGADPKMLSSRVARAFTGSMDAGVGPSFNRDQVSKVFSDMGLTDPMSLLDAQVVGSIFSGGRGDYRLVGLEDETRAAKIIVAALRPLFVHLASKHPPKPDGARIDSDGLADHGAPSPVHRVRHGVDHFGLMYDRTAATLLSWSVAETLAQRQASSVPAHDAIPAVRINPANEPTHPGIPANIIPVILQIANSLDLGWDEVWLLDPSHVPETLDVYPATYENFVITMGEKGWNQRAQELVSEDIFEILLQTGWISTLVVAVNNLSLESMGQLFDALDEDLNGAESRESARPALSIRRTETGVFLRSVSHVA